MNNEKKELLDIVERIPQAVSAVQKLIDEGKIMPFKVLRGASVEDIKICLAIPPEFRIATAGVKAIEFRPYLSKLTIQFE